MCVALGATPATSAPPCTFEAVLIPNHECQPAAVSADVIVFGPDGSGAGAGATAGAAACSAGGAEGLHAANANAIAATPILGRTAVLLGGTFFFTFFPGLWLHRRRPELMPFIAYWVAMAVVMGLVFTFHAPRGAFYHSAPAWLPFALPMAVGLFCR